MLTLSIIVQQHCRIDQAHNISTCSTVNLKPVLLSWVKMAVPALDLTISSAIHACPGCSQLHAISLAAGVCVAGSFSGPLSSLRCLGGWLAAVLDRLLEHQEMHGREDAVLTTVHQALGHIHQHVMNLLHTSRTQVQEGCGRHDSLVDVVLRPGALQPPIPANHMNL